jgi:hypothetical protein
MIQHITQRLAFLCDTIPAMVKAIPEAALRHKLRPDKWSKLEILGHLIDSATNNHQRFVRIQFEDTPKVTYDQNQWNKFNNYNALPLAHVIDLWELYNRHLLEVIKIIPEERLQRTGMTNEPQPLTLHWLIVDYLKHLEYHLVQVVGAYDDNPVLAYH